MLKIQSDDEKPFQEHTIQDAMQQEERLLLATREEMNHEHKSAFGQFFTPSPVAQLMASMLTCQEPVIRILDAGAGLGALFTAAVTAFCQRETPPEHILVTAYEIDDTLLKHLERAMQHCEHVCAVHGIKFTGTVKHEDFIESGVALLSNAHTLFASVDYAGETKNSRGSEHHRGSWFPAIATK